MMTRFMAETLMQPDLAQSQAAPLNNEDLRGHEAELTLPLILRVLPRRLQVWALRLRTDTARIEHYQASAHLSRDIGVNIVNGRISRWS